MPQEEISGLNIYFAGSIRGGRQKAEDYKIIIRFLSAHGTVLTEHVGDTKLTSDGEFSRSSYDIFTRDVSWIDVSNIVVAEVTVPSIGVGYEVAYAESRGKKVICLYNETEGGKLSAMIAGNTNILVIDYRSFGDLFKKLLPHLK